MRTLGCIAWVMWLACTASACTAQREADEVLRVSIQKPLVTKLPFNKIIVRDLRSDTANIGYNRLGHPIRFDTTVAVAIKMCIQSAIRNYAMGGNTVLMDIRELRVVGKSLRFSGDFYHKKNDSLFIRLATTNGLSQPVSLRPGVAMNRLLNNLIGLIDAGFSRENDSNRVPEAQLKAMALYDRPQPDYPIIESDTYPAPGYYQSFVAFRNNEVVPSTYSIHMKRDSAYAVSFPQRAHDRHRHSFRRIQDSVAFLRDARALSDSSGTLYLHVIGNTFLPLHQERDTFYLHVPSTLPNMYSILKVRDKFNGPNGTGSSGLDLSGGNWGGSSVNDGRALIVLAALVGVIIVADITVTVIKNDQIKKIYAQGLASKDFRECALDMDTGEFIYTRPADQPK